MAFLLVVLFGEPAIAHAGDLPPTASSNQGETVWDQELSRRYAHTRWRLFFLRQGALFALLAAFALTGASAALRNAIGEKIGPAWAADATYFAAVVVLFALLMAPLSFYGGYAVEHRFGLSNQTPGSWLLDSLKSLGVTLVIAVPLLMLFYAILRRWPERWWLVFSGACVPLIVFLVVIAPVVIDPLFNEFRPLEEGPLKSRLLEMASEQGVSVQGVFVVDKSKQTKKVNAYVTGLFGSKRIVLWDTLLQRFTAREVQAVMAHEMGHYVKRHVWWGVAVAALTVAVLSCIVARWAPLLVALLLKSGILRVQEAASLPMIAALFMFLLFFASPLTSAASRHMERTADRFALHVTGDGAVAARAFEKLAGINLADPEPSRLLVFWFYSHPPVAERIREARAYGRRQPP
ncbi:MAG: M48 family metallopeptidase [Armatimonadota bacterium]